MRLLDAVVMKFMGPRFLKRTMRITKMMQLG